MTTTVRRAAAPLALMAVIFFLSAQSDPGADVGAVGRVVAHAGEYALLCLLWAWALLPSLRWPAPVVAAAAISLAYAASDEFHQSFVPGREASAFDLVVDTAGIALAVALALARLSPRAGRSRTG
ncbi:MAG TPA: VanZ family protein [Solirubrobacterales bacterium]|nr:VanZ family protein [Solirubrobacterales bacterium]